MIRIEEMERGRDGSRQFEAHSESGNKLDFAIDDFLWLHSWHCPGEGKLFLDFFENFSVKYNLKIRVPTIVSQKLEKILEDRGYEKKRTSEEMHGETTLIDFMTIRIKKLREKHG